MTGKPKNNSNHLEIGVKVQIQGSSRSGRISEGPNQKGEYRVSLGSLEIWVPANKLEARNSSKKSDKKGKTKGRKDVILRKPSVDTMTIDLHGCSRQEAIEKLERLIDRAILAGASTLLIIHGRGTGAVRQAVHEYLSSSPHIARYTLEEHNEGSTRAYL